MQSQPPQLVSATPKSISAQFRSSRCTLPNLDFRSCCREISFGSNHANYCLVSSSGAGLTQSFQGVSCAIEEMNKKSFNSTFDGLRKIARHEGITTLWRGLSPTLVMGIPANIIYFTGYDWLRFDKNSPVNKLFPDNWSPVVAGSTARVLAATCVSPIEMFRTQMQARRSTGGNHFAETITRMNKIVASNGYRSLWRGLTLTFWRDVPFSGIYWSGYETIRIKLAQVRYRNLVKAHSGKSSQFTSRSQKRESSATTFTDSFIAGAISGMIASILTMPFDVGKTRRQVFISSKINSPKGTTKLAPEEYSMPKFMWHIFKEEGFAGLWKGWIPRTLKVAPACAIMISSYEIGKRTYRTLNEKKNQHELNCKA